MRLVGQYLHNWVCVLRHAEEAIAELGVEVLLPDRARRPRHAEV